MLLKNSSRLTIVECVAQPSMNPCSHTVIQPSSLHFVHTTGWSTIPVGSQLRSFMGWRTFCSKTETVLGRPRQLFTPCVYDGKKNYHFFNVNWKLQNFISPLKLKSTLREVADICDSLFKFTLRLSIPKAFLFLDGK